MAPKRTSDAEADGSQPSKKARKGFSVGPANLPDGTHRRKVQKIKKDLIHRAALKRSYAKLKEREPLPRPTYLRPSSPDTEPASLELHPARQAMLDTPEVSSTPAPRYPQSPSQPHRRTKPVPFAREAAEAQRRKEEAEARREAIEASRREREMKLEERERFRKAMAKARTGGKNGQRKLGRESKILLERVRRIVDT